MKHWKPSTLAESAKKIIARFKKYKAIAQNAGVALITLPPFQGVDYTVIALNAWLDEASKAMKENRRRLAKHLKYTTSEKRRDRCPCCGKVHPKLRDTTLCSDCFCAAFVREIPPALAENMTIVEIRQIAPKTVRHES